MTRRLGPWLICAALLGFAGPTFAQVSTGSIYGTVTDESGAVLPGATISISGSTLATRSTQSGTQGEFRFLNLDPGAYRLAVSLSGFATVNREVTVATGANVNLSFGMKVKQLEEAITVTGDAPVIDTKRVGTSTTLSKEELSQVPQSRDPWAVLKSVPGVLVDRVSIAGNEAGQQSVFAAKGASQLDTMYSLDGVTITDTACGGCSPSYYDFDAFDEIKVDTGGNDLKVATGGIGINFVTKRGTNSFHGGVHSFFSHDKLQSGNVPASLRTDPRLKRADGSFSDKAEHIDQINDWGADIGGPLVKDKLWFWGSYGNNDIRLRRFNQTQDKTLLKNWNAKVNWQASPNDMVSLFFFNGAKEKFGRSPGQAGNEPDSFLWNQGNFYAKEGCGLPCGAHGLFKIEDNHIFSPNFFVNAKYAFYNWGYGFAPRGGNQQDAGIDLANDTAYGSWASYSSLRPWHVANVDGNYFKTAGGGTHEFKFGFGYRRNPVTSTTTYSGSSVVAKDTGGGAGYALVYRDRVAKFLGENWSAYLGDTFTKGRLTVNAGARWDRQTAVSRDSSARANPLFPELVPGVSIKGSDLQGIKWNNISPRAGLSFALDQARKTVARASYARYAGQVNSLDTLNNNAVGAYYPYLAYNWVDLNGDHFAQKNEVLVGDGVAYSNVIDRNDPSSTSTPNTVDPNYKANIDHEFIVGLDRELVSNLALNVAYTWRRSSNIPAWTPRVGLTRADYTANAPVTVTTPEGTFTAQTYSPDPDKVGAGGRTITNRPDYHRGYNGLEVSLIRRLANKWMARAAFSWMDWQEHFDGPNAVQNPTPSEPRNGNVSGPLVEGGPVAIRSYGAKGDVYFNSTWQFNASTLYQLPHGFEVAGNVYGRQGYPFVTILRIPAGADGGTFRALGTPAIDSKRFESVWTVDLRAAKNFKVKDNVSMGVTADLFNVLNNDAVLQRSRDAAAADAFFRINELLNPRVARIGLRLQF